MNILIVEDEQEAVERLKMFLSRIEAEKSSPMSVVGVLNSVKEAIAYFSANAAPDLVLMDIHLSDGLSFEIFRHIEVNAPIIFTTAYNEYALHAFNVHSIAYLLKPFSYAEFEAAFAKLERHKTLFSSFPTAHDTHHSRTVQELMREIGSSITEQKKRFKTRFLLHIGDTMTIVPTRDIHYFYAEGKIVSMTLENGRKYIAEETLEEIESVLNPEEFFRISRKILLRAESIAGVEPYFNGRLALKLLPSFQGEVIVSRERVKDFRAWLEGA